MKNRRLIKRWAKIALCFLLWVPFELSHWGSKEVQALDTNIVEFMDIEVPALDAWGDFDRTDPTWWMVRDYMDLCDFSLHVKRDAYTITNIKFNKVTQTMSYDISPQIPKYEVTVTRNFDRYFAKYGPGSWMQLYQNYFVLGMHTAHFYGPGNFENTNRTDGLARDTQPYHGPSITIDDYYADTNVWPYPLGPNFYYGHYTGEMAINGGSFFVGPSPDWSNSFGITGIPQVLEFEDQYWTANGPNLSMQRHFFVKDFHSFKLVQNTKPSLTLISPNGMTIQNEQGQNIFNVEGYAQDNENNDLDLIVEVPNVYYRKEKITQTLSPKYFSVPIDAIADSLSPGTYQVRVSVVDPYNLKAEGSLSFNVVIRLKNKSFVLINDPVYINTTYSDYENDPRYSIRFRYDHDPYFFDNPMGIIPDSGLWRSTRYSSFPYSGVYTATFQLRDNPKNQDAFDPYRMWGRDNLSSMTFLVHRKPVALFSAKLINGSLSLADSSYDLDHTTSPNKGLIAWQWQYKKATSEVWTEGQPPSILPTSDAYLIRLRVRDVDGPNGTGVWSDWCQRTVGSSANLAPVAMFTVDPSQVSYRKTTTTTDKSFDPDNDPLDIYQWTVIKNGGTQVWSYYGGATLPPNLTAYGIGTYDITLKVHDNRGLWSDPYTQSVKVLNNPPAAAFSMPKEVYRDTTITTTNLTPDPDVDGDALTYAWNARVNQSPYYWAGNNRNQTLTVQNLMDTYGIQPKTAISDGWEMRLTASDGTLSSNATQTFSVKNHVPEAAIDGPADVHQYDAQQYKAQDTDEDSADSGHLDYYWRVMDSDGTTTLLRTPNITFTFNNTGVYTLQHWTVDPIGDKSNIATLKVNIAENIPPSMLITMPLGTVDNPTILDAEQDGDPLIQWTYSDPDDDPQEKYRLEFFTKDGLLAHSVENEDSTGLSRQYQAPDKTFERFRLFTLYGKAYSKYTWSDASNERAFIIDNPPVPGFTLNTDTGKDAVLTPINRTDILQIGNTATDADTAKGDQLTYQYFLKKTGGTESLLSTNASFTKQFSTNGTFTLRQVVTDSLGLWRETTHAFLVSNRLPTVNVTYPGSTAASTPTIVSTLTPTIKWDYADADGDEQQRFSVAIYDAASGALVTQSGEQTSSAQQWTVPANTLVENKKYAAEVTVWDGPEREGFGSTTSARKYMMANLLSVKGGVKHTAEWNANRQSYNLKQSGNPESPRAYQVFWAGEKFVLVADAAGLPDTVKVTMDGGFAAQLTPADENKTLWTGELYDPSFENLPDGPVSFTFTAQNEYNIKTDRVTVIISGDWSEYYRNHRIK